MCRTNLLICSFGVVQKRARLMTSQQLCSNKPSEFIINKLQLSSVEPLESSSSRPLSLLILSTFDGSEEADNTLSYGSDLLNSQRYVNVATTCLLCSPKSIWRGRGEGCDLSCGPDNIDIAKYKSEGRLMHWVLVSISRRYFTCLSECHPITSSQSRDRRSVY